jgi:hypothetical protein
MKIIYFKNTKEMSRPSQIFIQSMFTHKELMSTKRAEASRIMGLVNNLSLEDIKVVSQYNIFLENNGFIPNGDLIRTKEYVSETRKSTDQILKNNQQNFYFKPSATFQGSMPGWAFKTSSEGTGYYLEL